MFLGSRHLLFLLFAPLFCEGLPRELLLLSNDCQVCFFHPPGLCWGDQYPPAESEFLHHICPFSFVSSFLCVFSARPGGADCQRPFDGAPAFTSSPFLVFRCVLSAFPGGAYCRRFFDGGPEFTSSPLLGFPLPCPLY